MSQLKSGALTPDQVVLLFKEMRPNTDVGLRNRALVALILGTGLRISDVLDLPASSFHLADGYLTVPHRSGTTRKLQLPSFCVPPLKAWAQRLRELGFQEGTPFFAPLRKGPHGRRKQLSTPLDAWSIQQYLRRVGKRAGIPIKVTPHVLRATFAVWKLHGGCSQKDLQQLLGCRSPVTVRKYEALAKEREFSPQDWGAAHTKIRELQPAHWPRQETRITDVGQKRWVGLTKSWFRCADRRRDGPPQGYQHWAPFPCSFVVRLIHIFTRAGEKVLDPFAGSGTTLVGAAMTGRIGIGLEIDERYACGALLWLDRVLKSSRVKHYPQLYLHDARRLDELDLPQIDFCLTSPPYWGITEGSVRRSKPPVRDDRAIEDLPDTSRSGQSGSTQPDASVFSVKATGEDLSRLWELVPGVDLVRHCLLSESVLPATPRIPPSHLPSSPREAPDPEQVRLLAEDLSCEPRGWPIADSGEESSDHPRALLTAPEGHPLDLALIPDYDQYLEELHGIFAKVHALLKPGGYVVLVVRNLYRSATLASRRGDSTEPDEVIPLAWDVPRRLSDLFHLRHEMVWCKDRRRLPSLGWPTRYMATPLHDYCIVMQKPAEA
ncbi:MAG: tyrosine-type recombinase/integrase [Armatimonadetes bacterium]|nr:tyrosine-type recombinase/integrase [Armatimonadota bacterium]